MIDDTERQHPGLTDRPSANLLAELPTLAKHLAEGLGLGRDYVVLSRYYGLGGQSRLILEEIGRGFGLTRERVRQLRNRLRQHLSNALSGNAADERLVMPSPFMAEAAELKRLFGRGPALVSEADIISTLALRYGREISGADRGSLQLLLEVLGLRLYGARALGIKGTGRYWSAFGPVNLPKVRAVVEAIEKHLMDHPEGTTWFDVSISATRAAGCHVDEAEARELGALLSRVETLDDGNIRVRFDRLPSNASRAYRILAEEGNPLHFREISSRIREAYRTLGTQGFGIDALGVSKHLSVDPRFVPVGRSGRWMLSHWTHVRGDPVVVLMREFLEQRGEPATHDQMWAFISELRPDVRRSTLLALTHVFPERFVRLKQGRFAIPEWDIDPEEIHQMPRRRQGGERKPVRAPVRERVSALIREFLRKQPGGKAPLRELRAAVRNPEGGIKDPTVYWVIRFMDDVRKFDLGNVRYVELISKEP